MNNPVLFEGEHLVFRRCRGWEYVEHRTAKESVMVVARTLGIPVAWINRKSELRCRAAEPDAEVSNLTGLSDWLESGRLIRKRGQGRKSPRSPAKRDAGR